MKKVWNRDTREYEYEQEGVWVDGVDYDHKGAMAKWKARDGASRCRKSMAEIIIRRMIVEKQSFEKHHHWLDEIDRQTVIENGKMVAVALGRVSPGKSGQILHSAIPAKFRPAIRAILKDGGGGYSRGAHQTNPARQTGGFSDYKEYQLTSPGRRDGEGRATTAVRKREVFIWYSTTHAHATYNYQLITFPFRLNGMFEDVVVPMTGGIRDKVIKRPKH